MNQLPHSAPNSPDLSISEFHHHTSQQSSIDLQPLIGFTTHRSPISQGKHDPVVATLTNTYPPAPSTLESGNIASNNANTYRWSHYIHQGTSYDPSNAKEDYLRMAKDDVPDNKVSSASSILLQEYSWLTRRPHVLGGPFLPLPH